ncbi:MAG: hypothetical protein AAGL98_05700, partial [Planctomycetota bacterium]
PCSLPPRVPSAWSHDLKEANALRRELVSCPGRVVYLHGHIHKPWHTLADPTVAAGNGNGEVLKGAARFNAGTAFECINAGSPCYTTEKYPRGQGFWEIDLPADPGAPLKALHHVPIAPSVTDVPAAEAVPSEQAWRVGPMV